MRCRHMDTANVSCAAFSYFLQIKQHAPKKYEYVKELLRRD
jgi:hypothetical protein